jgi:2',3'-cyclic-nucleotide 2'-phosphodiesterase (5'-nucleotidase family)
MTGSQTITIMQMNDSHAYFEEHWELFRSGTGVEYRKAGGYARIAQVLNRVRSEYPERTLAFDCGDTIHGTYAAVNTRGEALAPILRALGFKAMTAHWEFAYGPERFLEITGQLPYPALAANCYRKDSSELVFPPYAVLESGGMRIGALGIAATIVDKTMPPSFSEGIRFTMGNEELPAWIEKLRTEEKADLIVLLSHLGFPQDVKLAGEVDGIDILLSGHTHNRLYQPVTVGNTIIIQSGCHGSFLGRLDIGVENGRIANYRHQLITIDEKIPPDPNVKSIIDRTLAPWRTELAQAVGITATALNRNTVLESTMDNLLLQAISETAGTPIAFSNGWRYGAPVPPGPVTLNDLYNIIPMDPVVSVTELSGEELRTMMEENLEHTFSHDPYRQMGGYVKRFLGITLYLKPENPAGTRIQEMFALGEKVAPDKTYTAAFVTSQGVPAKYGSNRRETDIHAVEALKRYLSKHNPAYSDLHGAAAVV